MSLSSSAVLYVGQEEVMGREPQVGDQGGASRWARPRPPGASSLHPSGPALPTALPAALRRPHLLPRGPEPRPLPAHPRQGCQGVNKSVLATSTEVPSPRRTLTVISLIIGVEKCQLTPEGPRRPALSLGAWLRDREGGASLIVVLSMPELSLERNRLRKAVLPCELSSLEMTSAVCWCRDADLLFYKDLKNLITTRIYVMLYRNSH